MVAATTRHLARSRGDYYILASIGASRRTVIGLATAETMPAAVLAGILAGTVPLLLARFTPFGASARGIDPHTGAPPGLLVLVAAGAALAALTVALAATAAIATSRPRRAEKSRASASPLGLVAALTPLALVAIISGGFLLAIFVASARKGLLRPR